MTLFVSIALPFEIQINNLPKTVHSSQINYDVQNLSVIHIVQIENKNKPKIVKYIHIHSSIFLPHLNTKKGSSSSRCQTKSQQNK